MALAAQRSHWGLARHRPSSSAQRQRSHPPSPALEADLFLDRSEAVVGGGHIEAPRDHEGEAQRTVGLPALAKEQSDYTTKAG